MREKQKHIRLTKSALEEISSLRSRHPMWITREGCQGIKSVATVAQLKSCMLVRRTADSGLNFWERVCFIPIRLGGARQAKLDPKWHDEAFIGIRHRSDEMLIMTSSGVYKTRNVRRRPKLDRWDFEFRTTFRGYALEPEPDGGEMAADALPADMAVPMLCARTSLFGRGGSACGQSSQQIVHQET